MPDPALFAVFLAAALVIAATPGPGILYVAGRTLAGGRAEGFASTIGTCIGGLIQVAAGAGGIAALVMASAAAFTALKFAGALYLIALGIAAWRNAAAPLHDETAAATGVRKALRQGIIVEATNPKTAAFFLAFLPQFIHPGAGVALPFAVLGLVSVMLNTLADAIVVHAAAAIRTRVMRSATIARRLRQGSAAVMCGLGLSLAFARRP